MPCRFPEMRLCRAVCCYIVTENAVKILVKISVAGYETHVRTFQYPTAFFISTGLENKYALIITSWIFLS